MNDQANIPQDTVSHWLATRASTANQKDLQRHLNLISKQVRLLGVPDFDIIDYDNWARQCKHEFETNVLKQVSYEGLSITGSDDNIITFTVRETVEGTDGTKHLNALEIIIEKEDDGQWRVTRETVLPPTVQKRPA